MSLLAQLAIAALIFVAGVAGGIRWHAGEDAIAARKVQATSEAAAREDFRVLDRAAGDHAAQLATLNTQLGDARARISKLSGRTCLDADAVGLLNATGVPEPAAPASEPASAAATAPAAAGDRAASDVDVAGYVALCRTRYAEVAGQLDQILDVEERRHPRPLP